MLFNTFLGLLYIRLILFWRKVWIWSKRRVFAKLDIKNSEILWNKDDKWRSCLVVFSFLLLFNLTIFFNIVGFLFASDLLILLVLLFKSIFGGLIDVIPHHTNDFGDLGDFGIWMFGLNLVINFLSEEEKCRESSFWSWWLN